MSTNKNEIGIIRKKSHRQTRDECASWLGVKRRNKCTSNARWSDGHLRNGGDDVGDDAGDGDGAGGPESVGIGLVFISDENNINKTGGGRRLNVNKTNKYRCKYYAHARMCACAIPRGELSVEPSPLSPAYFELSTGRTAGAVAVDRPVIARPPLEVGRHRFGIRLLRRGRPSPLGKSRASPTVTRRRD